MAEGLAEKEAGEETNEETEKTREDEDEDDHSTSGKRGKHSKKHRHKHSKKHKHKHKKRKHKKRSPSRSRSKSSSRSRSRSPDSNVENLDIHVAEADMRVASSEENGTAKQESSNKTMDLGGETQDLKFDEIAQAEAEDISFKLTKSPPLSPSAAATNEAEMAKAEAKAPDASKIENKINLGFPLKIGSSLERKSKSPDLSEQKAEGKRSRSPDDPEIKNRSQSPSDPKRSKSPESKIKKKSQSRSRSRSRMKMQSRKSRSKSPRKHSKKKSRSSMSSRSSSRSGSRSRSCNKHRSRSKSRSRSPQKHKQRGRSRSRSSSYSRKKSKKRERSRSKSRKSRSRSPRKKSRGSDSKTRGRSRSPAYRDRRSKRDTSYDRKHDYHIRSRRSRSHENRYSRKSRSISPPRSHRRRSHSRSPRRGRSRSPRRDRHRYRSRSRSMSGRNRHRSRSRSYSSRRRRSKSRSRSRSRDRQRRRSRSKSKEKNNEENKGGEKSEAPAVIPTNTNKPTAQDLVGKAPTVTDPTNKRSLAQLTEFCKKLTEARGIETEGNGTEIPMEEEEEDTSVEISHPFLVAPKKDITIPQVILPPHKLFAHPMMSSDKPLTEQFPVSCGTKHHEKEQESATVGQIIPDVDGSAQQTQHVFMPPQNQQKLDISGLVVKRMEAQRRLQADPNDLDAMLSLQEVEMKLNSWCQSNVKPGQFTGQLAKTMMPKEKMNTGYQAWAKKDMFRNLNPISGGIGMKLLQKMGWEPGQVLGKRGQGMVEPIALTVKVDRKGLSSNTEKPVGKKGGGNKQNIDLQGKHPISSLQEYCARRKWQVPEFTLIFDEGPPHSKQFLFKVAVNGYEYQHPVVSSNKKHAKAQAAVAALKGLGLVPEDADY